MNFGEYKNKKTFKVPDNYFENLSDSIMTMLPKETREKKSRKIKWGKAQTYICYAAMIVVIFTLSVTLTTKNTNTIAEEYIDAEFIDEILDNYPIDDYTFYCSLTGNDINF